MSVYAAANICMAVENFKGRGYAELGGIILNKRGIDNETEAAETLACDFNTSVISSIDRNSNIPFAEKHGMTVFEACYDTITRCQLEDTARAVMASFGGAV